MKEEIAAGLRNALERGQSLEQAVQSFINAGYNSNDVREAASSFSGASSIVFANTAPKEADVSAKQEPLKEPPKSDKSMPVPSQPANEQNIQESGMDYIPKKKSSGRGVVIAMVVILVLLVGFLIASLLFKTQILDFIKSFSG